MSETKARAKTSAGNVSMTFDLHLSTGTFTAELELDVTTLRREDKARKFTSLCPHCHGGLTQHLACDEHGAIEYDDVVKGKRLDDDSLVPVTQEEIETVNAPTLETGRFRVGVYDGKSVDHATFTNGAAYRLRPSMQKAGSKKRPTPAKWLQAYAILHGLVSDRSIAVLAEWTNRGATKLYRIEPFGAQLVLRELVRPEEIVAEDDLDVPEIAADLIANARQGVIADHFDPAEFADQRTKRAQALVEAKAAGTEVVMPTESASIPDSDGLDLVAALEASLAKTKPAKAKRARKAA